MGGVNVSVFTPVSSGLEGEGPPGGNGKSPCCHITSAPRERDSHLTPHCGEDCSKAVT